MAESFSHKWGQIIGEFLEEILKGELSEFSQKHALYLDFAGVRPARLGKKVSWIDSFGNSHDLDFVLERNGSGNHIGEPVAFIEIAWRRYTKHSRNKAQEIQGAILPLVAMHKNLAPFIGVVLAGEFTQGALDQLRSVGFQVLYFPYKIIAEAFQDFGLNAAFEENTSEDVFQEKIKNWNNFADKKKLAKHILKLNHSEVESFFGLLEQSISRFVSSISVMPLHGKASILPSIDLAVDYVRHYSQKSYDLPVYKYDIQIKFNNGDLIDATFRESQTAIVFLESYGYPKPKRN